MKKETGIAVFLGILAGIGIAVFVILSTRGGISAKSGLIQDDAPPTVASTGEGTSPLVISSPQEEAVVTTDEVAIKGSAQKNALVVIQSPADEIVVKSENGTFSGTIGLSPGENTIKVTTYSAKNIDSRSVVIFSLNDQ